MAFQRIQGHLSFARKSWIFEDFQSLGDVSRIVGVATLL